METKKIALVTGGNRGLGRDMALSLAKKNIDVIITYNSNKAEAEAVISELTLLGSKAIALQLNLKNVSSLTNFVAQVAETLQTNWHTDKLDFLINNAGIGATIPFAEVTEENFDEFLNIHFKGVYFLTQKMLVHLNNNGSIVNISTGTTRFCIPGYSVYASMKGAIEVFTKYLAKELGQRGIRANVVAPGPIETDFNNAAIRNNPQMKGFLGTQTALGRVGYADDIGGVVAFLCSEDSKWVNGQRIEVTGGIML
jgi:NAD(P)-dependent dehydrogenase (short-subunit alcohol dehydrogenase family)